MPAFLHLSSSPTVAVAVLLACPLHRHVKFTPFRSHLSGCVRSGSSVCLTPCRSTHQTLLGAAQFGRFRHRTLDLPLEALSQLGRISTLSATFCPSPSCDRILTFATPCCLVRKLAHIVDKARTRLADVCRVITQLPSKSHAQLSPRQWPKNVPPDTALRPQG